VRRRLCVLGLVLVFVVVFVGQGYAYKLINSWKYGYGYGSVSAKVFMVLQAGDVQRWWKDELKKVYSDKRQKGINWLSVLDPRRMRLADGTGESLMYIDANYENKGIYMRELRLKVKPVKVTRVMFKAIERGVYVWWVYRKHFNPMVNLIKGKDLRRGYELSMELHPEAVLKTYMEIPGHRSFAELVNPIKHHAYYYYSIYYPELGVTLTQLFGRDYSLDAFDKVIAVAKKQGIIK